MASLTFIDKENTSSFGTRHKPRGSSSGPAVKSFQSSNVGALVTPRKALGAIQAQTPIVKQSDACLHKNTLLKQTLTQNIHSSVKRQPLGSVSTNTKRQSLKQEKSQMAPPVLKTSLFPAENQRLSSVDDIEHCPTLDDPEDPFQDKVIPRNESITLYLDRLISWRPPCLFGEHPVSDEEDERIMAETIDRIPVPPLQDLSLEPIDLMEPIPIEDIHLSYLEDDLLLALDDSIILSDFGSLHLHDI